MNIEKLISCMTPAEQGCIWAVVESYDGQGDDEACGNIRDALYLNDLLDLDYSAADRLAYGIVHDCKRR